MEQMAHMAWDLLDLALVFGRQVSEDQRGSAHLEPADLRLESIFIRILRRHKILDVNVNYDGEIR